MFMFTMLLLSFLLLFSIFIYLIANPRDLTVRWAIAFGCCGAIGGISLVLQRNIFLKLAQTGHLPDGLGYLLLWKSIIYTAFISQVGFPYCILVFSLIYSNVLQGRKLQWIVSVLLMIPNIMLYLATPFSEDKVLFDKLFLDYNVYIFWGLPYELTAVFLLIYAPIKEKNSARKKHYLKTSIMLVPTILAATYINLICKVIYVYPKGDYMYLMPYFIFYSFVVHMIFLFRDGLFGVKIKLEKQADENTIIAATTLAAMLNHGIKNKINFSTLILENVLSKIDGSSNELKKDLQGVLFSNHDIMTMVRRIQDAIDFQIVPEENTLRSILESTIENTRMLFERSNMKCITHYSCEANFRCDRVHIDQMFTNFIKNAIEAMEPGKGILEITLYESNKEYVIQFRDNGHGISKEDLKRIFMPFYSTKKREQNDGLGLTYCYLVLEKHRANIKVERLKTGTSFSLTFPKIRRVKNKMFLGVKNENKSAYL
ncbi:sensor histidine kinase [Paenibacillus humicola]|uniref:sensor histidine kinase n=1 Tax=Paenibacillus humicola TaxID=3110540 RepID=UPI00237BDCDF|nr:HAMP domain-containing sensor histidine kinase [Paenibacillus humicola]